MQEGTLALMQLAKTMAALERLAAAGVPFLSVLSDPTTGGVFASFAAVGDVNIAEPDALIGFAGARVTAGTIAAELPPGLPALRVPVQPRLRRPGRGPRRPARRAGPAAAPAAARAAPGADRRAGGRTCPASARCRSCRPSPTGWPMTSPAVTAARGDGAARWRRYGDRPRTRRDSPRRRPRPPAAARPGRRPTRPATTSGRGSRRPARCAARGPSSSSPRWPRSWSSCTATACSATTPRWSPALARLDGRRVVVVGQQKGADTDENIRRNFGMPHPEGYRKAMRVDGSWPSASACRSSPSSTSPAPTPARSPRSAASPRRSPARSG